MIVLVLVISTGNLLSPAAENRAGTLGVRGGGDLRRHFWPNTQTLGHRVHSGRQQGHRVSPPVAGLVIIPSLRSAEECANLVVSKSCVPLPCPVSFLG